LETPGHTVKGFGQSPSLGIGTALIASHVGNSAYSISLTNSLHVPDARYNLISIGCMTRTGFSVQFKGDTMKVLSPGLPPVKSCVAHALVTFMRFTSLTAPPTLLPMLLPMLVKLLIHQISHSCHQVPTVIPGTNGIAFLAT
jgi:hypothetical protein